MPLRVRRTGEHAQDAQQSVPYACELVLDAGHPTGVPARHQLSPYHLVLIFCAGKAQTRTRTRPVCCRVRDLVLVLWAAIRAATAIERPHRPWPSRAERATGRELCSLARVNMSEVPES